MEVSMAQRIDPLAVNDRMRQILQHATMETSLGATRSLTELGLPANVAFQMVERALAERVNAAAVARFGKPTDHKVTK
jgi:hypothetical protein